MGHAAYLRGNKVIREQIDRDGPDSISMHVSALEANVDRLRLNNERLRQDLDRAMLHLRERRSTVTALYHDLTAAKGRARAAERAMIAYRRRWVFVSRLLRMCASPSQVANARNEIEETTA